MSVKTCHRKGCENIMCDTYVSEVGYVCNECQSEFRTKMAVESVHPETEGEIVKQLKLFISTEKEPEGSNEKITISEFFNKNTKL